MSRKRPRSKDPHSWIKDTTKTSETPKAKGSEATESPRTEKARARPKATPQRFIYVEFDPTDGSIIASHELHREAEESAIQSWTSASKDRLTARVPLTGELFDKDLIDIHNDYRVVISRKKPTLVPKG